MKPLVDPVLAAQFDSIQHDPVIMLQKENAARVRAWLRDLFVAVMSAGDVSKSFVFDPAEPFTRRDRFPRKSVRRNRRRLTVDSHSVVSR